MDGKHSSQQEGSRSRIFCTNHCTEFFYRFNFLCNNLFDKDVFCSTPLIPLPFQWEINLLHDDLPFCDRIRHQQELQFSKLPPKTKKARNIVGSPMVGQLRYRPVYIQSIHK